MAKKQISSSVGIIILIALTIVSLYVAFIFARGAIYYSPINSREIVKQQPDPMVTEVGAFMINYLEAYKDIAKNKNYEDVVEFISESALVQMKREGMPFDKNAADFDNYEILTIKKANHEEYAPLISGYIVDVKLFKDGQVLKNADGEEITKISALKENGSWHTPSWYFGF